MKACRHHGFRQLCAYIEYAPGVESTHIDHHQDTGKPIRKVLVAAHRCHDCGAWLSLGPAAPDTEAVRVERRAAELAAPGDCEMSLPEHAGWSDGDESIDDDAASLLHWQAGCLARAIATHDEGSE